MQALAGYTGWKFEYVKCDCCLRSLYDEYGNVYIVVDMELKGRIREALIKMILGFDIEDMDLEPEE